MRIHTLVLFLLLGLSLCMTPATAKKKKASKAEPEVQPQVTAEVPYQGLKRKVAIARFSNETEYAKGAFYDKDNDPIGKQAVDILTTKLTASGKFILMERAESDLIQKELDYAGQTAEAQKIGADYLIIGSVTEFGRKNTGVNKVFSQKKLQTVTAGVSIRLVDVSTGEIIYSEEGKGEAETETDTVLGFGGVAGYDATLSDKAISAAISQLVENVINNCMDRPWKSYILSYDSDGMIIAGGEKQGVKAGDVYTVYRKGKKVKNPQTGIPVELPGKEIGKVTVLSTGGASVTSEFAMVELTKGKVDAQKLEEYEIRGN